jgi:hypothetical protein
VRAEPCKRCTPGELRAVRVASGWRVQSTCPVCGWLRVESLTYDSALGADEACERLRAQIRSDKQTTQTGGTT